MASLPTVLTLSSGHRGVWDGLVLGGALEKPLH